MGLARTPPDQDMERGRLDDRFGEGVDHRPDTGQIPIGGDDAIRDLVRHERGHRGPLERGNDPGTERVLVEDGPRQVGHQGSDAHHQQAEEQQEGRDPVPPCGGQGGILEGVGQLGPALLVTRWLAHA